MAQTRIAAGDAVSSSTSAPTGLGRSRGIYRFAVPGFARPLIPNLHYVCMTEYDETFTLPIAFPPDRLNRILGQVVADAGLQQLRIAETEKYPHVTFFFNGGARDSAARRRPRADPLSQGRDVRPAA